MKMKNKIIKIFFCNLKFLFFYKMSLEENIKNECLKTYDYILEKIKLLSPLIDTEDINKNLIKINELITFINKKCSNIEYILRGYEDLKRRLEDIKKWKD